MAAAAAAAPVGDDEVAMPDAARAEPKFAAVYEALAARRKAGVTYVVNEGTGCLALEPKADFVDTYGHVFEADLKDPDGVPTLWLICKLPKEDGVVCNRATQVSRVDGGVIKIKSGNVADHLLTHGMSANLTPSHQQKVRDAKAAKAGATRAKPSSGGASGADASPVAPAPTPARSRSSRPVAARPRARSRSSGGSCGCARWARCPSTS